MNKKKYFFFLGILLLNLIIFTLSFDPDLHAEKLNIIQDEDLISGLISSDEGVVKENIKYISQNKPLTLLTKLAELILSNENARCKSNAVKAISLYPFNKTLSICLDILEKSPSFLVKKEIIDYIAESNDRRIVEPLLKELNNPFYAVRESAILALKKIGDDRMFPHVLNMMEDENPVFRVYALEAIYYMYDMRFFSYLVNMLHDKNKSVRYYVLRCIENNKLDKSLNSVRSSALNDESWEVRIKAIEIIGDFRDKDGLYVLLQCLKDSDREVRYYSSQSLYKLNHKASAVPLSVQLFSEKDDEIKVVIIDTLIRLENAGGYKGLREVLMRDKKPDLRIRSAFALGQIRAKTSSAILTDALKDSDPEVRAEVCNSLGYYQGKDNILNLLNLVNDDPDTGVRSAALYSIKRIGGNFAILPLFDRYGIENDHLFREMLRQVLRTLIREST